MRQIPLSTVPRQTISVTLDGAYWQISLYMSIDKVCADISRNGDAIINGVRCFAGLPLMPFEYQHLPTYGNFYFDSDVDWEQFNNTCNLYYLDVSDYLTYKALEMEGLQNVAYYAAD